MGEKYRIFIFEILGGIEYGIHYFIYKTLNAISLGKSATNDIGIPVIG